MLAELDELDSTSGWVPLFQKLNWIAKENAGSQKIAKLPENRQLNRYRDVLPYDHSRVVLKAEDGDTDYINANFVEVPLVERKYILAQGPLKHTSAHFWQMVWEQNCKAVIMLNRVVEKNQIKCYQYWPCGEKVGHTNVLEFGNFRITYLNENMREFFTVKTLELYNIKKDEKRKVYHFHYLHWPDFGVPSSPGTFLSFLFEARNAGVLSKDVGPAVIHCSAGIGRSGTYVMVDTLLKEIEQTRDLNGVDIKKTLLEIRRYRLGLIQTPDQLRFTYAAILEGTHILFPEVYDEALDKFLEMRGELEEDEDEEPPPLPPPRKRPEAQPQADEEDNIQAKRKKNVPDVPSKPESEANNRVTLSESDDSEGEDEIIDLSASSSSLSADEDYKAKTDETTTEKIAVKNMDSPQEDRKGKEAKESKNVKEYEDSSTDSIELNKAETTRTVDKKLAENEKTVITPKTTQTKPNKTDKSPVMVPQSSVECTSSEDIIVQSTSKESEAELRKRQRQEKKEKTAKLVKDIKDRVKHEEDTVWVRSVVKKSLIAVAVCVAAYLAYRCYRYFTWVPRRRFPRV